MRAKRMFFNEDVTLTNAIRDRLVVIGALRVTTRLSADVLVARDISKPGTRTLWIAGLLGLPIVGCPTILNDRGGPLIVYGALVTRRLSVYMSVGFRRVYPNLVKLIAAVSAKPQSAWRMLSHAPSRCKSSSVIVLASPAEVARGRLSHAISPATFISKYVKPVSMSMGVCGL